MFVQQLTNLGDKRLRIRSQPEGRAKLAAPVNEQDGLGVGHAVLRLFDIHSVGRGN